MADRLFGMETEYAVTGAAPGGVAIDRQNIVHLMQAAAAETFAHAADINGGGVFLQNGSRFYIDCGLHPELATPECTAPGELVRYVLAGDRILAILAGRVPSQLRPGTSIEVFRCNVDYSGSGATWGCHESYLHRADPAELAAQIIPHLATRIVYTGAGGFNPLSAGLEFSLSPRVHHLVAPISGDSTSCRGIFHTKDEPLCGGGYHRLHVLCGESCCSQLATWLKIGTTALVVALAEAGLAPGAGVQLCLPVHAMRTTGGDPECRAPIALKDGRTVRAIDVQRHYLARAEAHLGDPFMPPWAEEVCRRWRATLDRLQAGPSSLSTELDWPIKRRLYERHARGRGLTWGSIAHWNHALATLQKALDDDGIQVRFCADALLGSTSPARSHVLNLAPRLRHQGLSLDDLPAFLLLRQEFLEIDTRFAQLGTKGIFAALDTAGALAHGAPGVERIEEAVLEPPAFGRAALRGKVIQRAAGSGQYVCGWDQVHDLQSHTILDLSDPFETTERWRHMRARERDDSGASEEVTAAMRALRALFGGADRPLRPGSRE